ncbi:MAG TPA: hypothetical protein VEU96_25620 [Bryobacteraceae bacterium]|nr:hypothetical protein [Bryobacteraceae bacterium]
MLVLVLLSVGQAEGQAPSPKISLVPSLPDHVTPGESIKVPGENFPEKVRQQVRIRTGKEKEGDAGRLVDAQRLDATILSFEIPKDLTPGRYMLVVKIEGQKEELLVPGELRVLSAAPKLEAVYPDKPNPRGDSRFDFEIAGENLGPKAEGNVVEIVGRGPVIARVCKDEQDQGPCLKVVDSGAAGRKLQVIGFPANDSAQADIFVRVGEQVSNSKTIEFRQPTRWELRLLALLVMALLLGFIAWLVKSGLEHSGGAAQPAWTVLFLDRQTNSYSLSKFQILWWIVVTALGYTYLFLCRTLVQGDFSIFPDIPKNLPDLLGVSAGTAVVIAGATAVRGSKGAGALEPTAADFITAGGLVNGERFQFFLWTLVAGLGFLSLLFMADPARLTKLPDVPDTLLYLTGVSAAGYVGGRLVRKPGPVIKNLAVTSISEDPDDSKPPVKMEFELQGEGLSQKGTVKIDDNPLRADVVTLESIPKDSTEEFSTKLKVAITKDAVEPCLKGPHTFTLLNPDQQSASARFPLDPMTIEAVDTTKAPWEVTGKNFADPTTVHKFPKSMVNRVDATKLQVTVTPAPAVGKFTLTLVSPAKLRASIEVTVPGPPAAPKETAQ